MSKNPNLFYSAACLHCRIEKRLSTRQAPDEGYHVDGPRLDRAGDEGLWSPGTGRCGFSIGVEVVVHAEEHGRSSVFSGGQRG